MLKKCLFVFSGCLGSSIYADNTAGNISNIVHTANAPSFQNMNSSSQSLDVKYALFDYQMKPTEFSKFLRMHDLIKSVHLESATNIIYLAPSGNQEFSLLSQRLTKDFPNKNTGMAICYINHGLCGSTGTQQSIYSAKSKITSPIKLKNMSILFKVYADNKHASVRIISDNTISYEFITPHLISFKATASLTAIENKNYVIISQVTKRGILYGQIMLVTFGGIA